LTPEQLERNQRENDAARKAFEAEIKAQEQAKVDARNAEAEAQLKANVRLRYSGMTDADFERLWPIRLRDDELMIAASASANRPPAPWYVPF
jgi:hypothetical protein